jgi:D-sedoheptulose 7-phosphate isomerase
MSLLTEPLLFTRRDLSGEHALACCEHALVAHREFFDQLPRCFPVVASAGERLAACLAAGGKLLLCGNGSAAATAHHLAALLMGRPARQGHPLAGLALSANLPTVTALGDRFGFDHIYARQVEALGRPGDALLVISSSHPARNLHHAVRAAREGGLLTIALLGPTSRGDLASACHLSIELPPASLALLDEGQLFVGHQLCAVIEAAHTNL